MAGRSDGKGAVSPVDGVGVGGGSVRLIPAAPGDLGPVGLQIWESVWSLPRVELADEVTIARLCRLEDEAARLRALIAEQGEVQREPVVGPKGDVLGERLVPHGGVALLRRAGKEARELGSELGLSPTSRNRMGLDVPDAEPPPDALDELRAQYRRRREEMGEQ